jgi:uncharacterized protein
MGDAVDVTGLAAHRHLLLTTFRADGTPVPTVVWAVRVGDDLMVITGARTGKVARIRRSPAVLVSPCGPDGARHPGEDEITATAQVVSDREVVSDLRSRIRARYGWRYTMHTALLRMRGGRAAEVAIRISVPPRTGSTAS